MCGAAYLICTDFEINSGNLLKNNSENVDDDAHHQNDGLRQILFVLMSIWNFRELLKFNCNAPDVRYLIHLMDLLCETP